jgi:adenylylsulfate kinase
MTQRILIMGLPGAGKTTLAQYVLEWLEHYNKKCMWLNADRVREEYNDWDFSIEGRIRQSKRMREMADRIECDYVICDFICPLEEMRKNFDADWTVWVDTITESRFKDTDQIFEAPSSYDFRIQTQDGKYWSELVALTILEAKPGQS